MATAEEFFAIDIRVGTVTRAEAFPEARKPSIKLWIDFGSELGERRSSAQLTHHYTADALVGRQVVAAMNLGDRRIAGFVSQVLVLGAMPEPDEVVLVALERPAPNGSRIA
jgi:tRNA-binding protein